MKVSVDAQLSLQFRRVVHEASRYVPAWTGIDRGQFIRLDLNESTQPFSDRVARALNSYLAGHGVQSYPRYDELGQAIAAYCGVPEPSVLPTNGSDQAIDVCLRAFLDPGDTMLIAQPEFVIFSHCAGLLGAETLGIPYGPELEFPYDAYRAALAQHPNLIVLINPNNPTGTPIDLSFVEEVLSTCPHVPVVVDEAYFEFTGVTAIPLLVAHPNLIVMRTFSKAFAMAGLRMGYILAHPTIIGELAKIRGPFDVNIAAVVAAQAQLEQLEEMHAHANELMTVTKPRVVEFFRQSQIPVWPGAANFILVRPPDCAEVVRTLRDAGVLVRGLTGPTLTGMFRMSIGTPDEMNKVLAVYAELLLPGRRLEMSDEIDEY